MPGKSFKVTIHRGTSTVDLDGFQGKGCTELAQKLAGKDKIVLVEHKREFDEEEVLPQQEHLQQ